MVPLPGTPAADVPVEFVKIVREWCEAHADKITRCVIAQFEGRPTIWVIATREVFDVALAKELSDWGMQLHRAGLPSMVHQLPGGDPDLYPHYFRDRSAIHVFGLEQESSSHADRWPAPPA